jgi:PBSX family phage terminase large subunit
VILSPPTGKQARSIVEASARLNIWEGSVRSGKTIGSIIRWLHFVASNECEGELLMAGKTERTLKRNVLDPISEMIGGDLKVLTGTGEGRLFGRRLYIAGANDERAEGKIRGMTLAGFYGDELTTWPQSFFQMATTRISLKGSKGFGTTNPDGPQHWLKKDYLDRAEEIGLARFHFKLEDNPALDPGYIAAVKKEFTGLWYRRFILGEWVQAEGAIFDIWDADRFVVRALPQITRKWVGVDYGTSNPFVALLFGLGEDGNVYVMSEYRHDSRKPGARQKTDAEYSADMRAWLTYHNAYADWTFVDPSAASFIQQLYRDSFEGVRPADNAVVDGIRVVSTALAQDRVRVHESCTGLIEELPGYVWDPKAQQKGEDRPIKTDDHSIDAFRYGLASSRWIWGRLSLAGVAA